MSDTRSRILAEATQQLTRVGYTSFTIAAVRDALELSSGSMFHAFGSKAALAAAVFVDGMADYQRAASAAIARASDPARGLRAFIAAHLGWVEDHRALAAFLFGSLPDEVMDEARSPLAKHNTEFFRALEALFDRAAEAGLMGRLERVVAQALCIGSAQEHCRQWARGQTAIAPRKLTKIFQEAALAALATTRGAGRRR